MVGIAGEMKFKFNDGLSVKEGRRNDDKEKAFMNLFSQCRDYGFTEEQILYILNLINASDNK